MTIQRGQVQFIFNHGRTFPLEVLGNYHQTKMRNDIAQNVWEAIENAQKPRIKDAPEHIKSLVALREQARQQLNWAQADRLRTEIEAQGWQVLDMPEGPRLECTS